MGLSTWLRRFFNGAKVEDRQRRARPRLEALEDREVPATFTVTSVANGGVGSLRAAITTANRTAGADTIDFAIGAAGSARNITLLSALPRITEELTIDGASQGGAGYAGPPLIRLIGTRAGATSNGLVIVAPDCTIQGLFIGRFRRDGILMGGNASDCTIGGAAAGEGNVISGNGFNGIEIAGAGCINNTIQGNLIGTNLTGTAGSGNGRDGILIRAGAAGNTVGGTAAGEGNVISSNGLHGVDLFNAGTTGNVIEGNLIGTNAAGTSALGNRFDGVLIRGGAPGNTVGGTAAGAENVISGNGAHGIEIVNPGTNANQIQGNLIGTNLAGTLAIANRGDGILIRGGAANTTVGGTAAGAGNVISGNLTHGIEIINAGTTGNQIQGNMIGTNLAGTSALGNRSDGILIRDGAPGNTIGGTAAGAENVISGNGNHGIEIVNPGTTNNLIQGNMIGVNAAGTAGIGNGFDGVLIRTGAAGNTVGGATAAAANVISANSNDGVEIVGVGTNNNVVRGNLIGTAADGVSNLGNASQGVDVRDRASLNVIGGTATGEGNTIAFNGGNGVLIGDTRAGLSAGASNPIQGNSIFSNGRKGIHLGFDNTSQPPAPLPNNALGHPGVNNSYQNYPVLDVPIVTATTTTLNGVLSSPNNPGDTFRIEFYSNVTGDGTGFGEGQTFLGAATVTTNAFGVTTISLTLGTRLASGLAISATATDSSGNTSEFAANVIVP
jgi:hypothetical protein